MFQVNTGSCVSQAGGGDGCVLDRRHCVMGCGWTSLRVVCHGPGERSAGGAHLHRGGVPAPGVGCRQAPLVVQPWRRAHSGLHWSQPHVLLLSGCALHYGSGAKQPCTSTNHFNSATPRDHLLGQPTKIIMTMDNSPQDIYFKACDSFKKYKFWRN